MQFIYDDLPQWGIVLVAPSSPKYDSLLEVIRQQAIRSDSAYPGALHGRTADAITPEQKGQSVILLNESDRAIALVQVLWHYTLFDGRSYLDSIVWVGSKTLLLPFQVREDVKKVFAYWGSHFPEIEALSRPGRGRCGRQHRRAPTKERRNLAWRLCFRLGIGYAGTPLSRSVLNSICRGAFFLDGEFVGKNHRKMFEEVASAGAAHQQIARLAKQKTGEGFSPKAVLEEVEKLTGPAGERRPEPIAPSSNTPAGVFEKQALAYAAWEIASMRRRRNDDEVLQVIERWGAVELPRLRKHA